MMRWAIPAVLLMLLGVPAMAQKSADGEDRSGLVWMSDDEIKTEFSNASLKGLYPSQRPWKEEIHPDGTTDYAEGQKRWRGEWWITARKFCFSYPPPGVGGCFRVTRISANCFELYEFGTSASHDEVPPSVTDLWNGRMWHADRPTTCEARPSV